MLLCEVLNEAVGVLVYGSLSLEREDLLQFKSLRVIVSLGVCGSGNVDVATASQLGVCVCVCVCVCVFMDCQNRMQQPHAI